MYFLSYDTQWRGRERIFLGERKLNTKSYENRVNKRTKKLHSCRMSTVFGGPLPPRFYFLAILVTTCFLFCFDLVRARRDLRDAVASLLYPHRRYFYRISLPFIFIFFLFYTLENYFLSYSLLTWLFTCIYKKIFFLYFYIFNLFFMLLFYFHVLILKIIFKNKKYYFNIFLKKKYFEPQSQL
jgi:hypothetical protein